MTQTFTANPVPMNNQTTLVDLVEDGHFLRVFQDQSRPNGYHVETDVDHLQVYYGNAGYMQDGRPDNRFVHKDSNFGSWVCLTLPQERTTSISYGRQLSMMVRPESHQVYLSQDAGKTWTALERQG